MEAKNVRDKSVCQDAKYVRKISFMCTFCVAIKVINQGFSINVSFAFFALFDLPFYPTFELSPPHTFAGGGEERKRTKEKAKSSVASTVAIVDDLARFPWRTTEKPKCEIPSQRQQQ